MLTPFEQFVFNEVLNVIDLDHAQETETMRDNMIEHIMTEQSVYIAPWRNGGVV